MNSLLNFNDRFLEVNESFIHYMYLFNTETSFFPLIFHMYVYFVTFLTQDITSFEKKTNRSCNSILSGTHVKIKMRSQDRGAIVWLTLLSRYFLREWIIHRLLSASLATLHSVWSFLRMLTLACVSIKARFVKFTCRGSNFLVKIWDWNPKIWSQNAVLLAHHVPCNELISPGWSSDTHLVSPGKNKYCV